MKKVILIIIFTFLLTSCGKDSEIKFGKVTADTKAVFSPGLHISQTRGFYRFRPCTGLEVNFEGTSNSKNGIPVSF